VDYSRFKMPGFGALSRRDYLLAACSGLLLALSFPKTGWSLCAWVAWVPLLLACGHKSPAKAWRLGLCAGLVGYGGILYWINIVVTTYGKLPLPVSIAVYLTLTAYMALYVGLLCYLVRRVAEQGIPLVLSFPVFWVGLEYLRSFLLTGFPWASLGYSQYRQLQLIQAADLVGVYGISFLIVFANVVLYLVLRGFARRAAGAGYPLRSGLVLLLLLLCCLGYGTFRLGQVTPGRPLQVALIQGNIDQGIKWDPAFMEATLSIYERLSRQAAAGADLVVWPESAAPFFFQEDGPPSARIRALARELQVPLVFGSPAFADDNSGRRYYNSAFLVAPTGEVIGRSDKVHLVPFGEYVPLARFLPFVNKLVEGVGDFSPGDAITALDAGKGRLGILVCFEGIFPELARRHVRSGAELLVNITNDGWYGRSSAPYQHLSMAVFRAVENHIPLVRAANTGITAIIDAHGRILQPSALFEEAAVTGQVRLGGAGTLYTRWGDLFAQACLLAVAAAALFCCRSLSAGLRRIITRKRSTACTGKK
jgi:apolipoprotein N-acyltransferase